MGAALTTVPNAPSGMTIMAGNGQAALNWNAPSDGGSPITTYKLYRSASQSGAYSILASPTGTSYTDGGLTSGQTYWYKVSAVNANGEGQASNPISTTIPGSDNTMIYVVLIVIIIAIAAVAIVYYMRHKDG
jgi:fibronectin type 3 domain-containing protein